MEIYTWRRILMGPEDGIDGCKYCSIRGISFYGAPLRSMQYTYIDPAPKLCTRALSITPLVHQTHWPMSSTCSSHASPGPCLVGASRPIAYDGVLILSSIVIRGGTLMLQESAELTTCGLWHPKTRTGTTVSAAGCRQ